MEESNGQLKVAKKTYHGILVVSEHLFADSGGYILCEREVRLFGVLIYTSSKYEKDYERIGWQKPENDNINKAA
jgi:hypothetical protein